MAHYPKLVAGFSYRYEPKHLINSCIKNLNPIVDDIVSLDDTQHDQLWRNEHDYRKETRELVRKAQADYILVMDVDERLEKDAREKIFSYIMRDHSPTKPNHRVYFFNFRELYSPTEYRTDGIWGKKTRGRIFQLNQDAVFDTSPIQTRYYPVGYSHVYMDINLYHLKQIEPENRNARVAMFKHTDPNNKYQTIGYDYLNDEEGMVLESIPAGREYLPAYRKFIIKPPKKYFKIIPEHLNPTKFDPPPKPVIPTCAIPTKPYL
jgi:hypothetical protein